MGNTSIARVAVIGAAVGVIAACSSGGDGQLGKLASIQAIVDAEVVSVGAHVTGEPLDYDTIDVDVGVVRVAPTTGLTPAVAPGTRLVLRSFDARSFTPATHLVLFLAHDARFADAWSVEFAFDPETASPAAQSADAATNRVIESLLLEGEDRSDLLAALIDLVDEYGRPRSEDTPRRDRLYPP